MKQPIDWTNAMIWGAIAAWLVLMWVLAIYGGLTLARQVCPGATTASAHCIFMQGDR